MHKTIIAALGLSSSLVAAQTQAKCAPEPGATCYPDDCTRCYCLGPENTLANAPVCPHTCDGDLSITVAGFYWSANQDGLEYAIDNHVVNNVPTEGDAQFFVDAVRTFNNLIDASYLSPKAKWDFGFKLGLSYCSPCDGWDFGINWTWFKGRASSHVEAEPDDNHVLLPLWSGFVAAPGGLNFATDIKTNWALTLNFIDLELGRDFWTSRYLSIRPHVGIRVALVEQDYCIEHAGGSWGSFGVFTGAPPVVGTQGQSPLKNTVELENDFKGAGIRAGLDSTWNLGCGWAIYGDLATSLIYGKFNLDHNEWNRIVGTAPGEDQISFQKIKVLETDDSLHASKAILDLGLGVQWMGMICDCKYGLTAALGWEQHTLFHQNQLFRVDRVGVNGNLATNPGVNQPNDTGINTFLQRRGNLSTQGVTLKVKFDF